MSNTGFSFKSLSKESNIVAKNLELSFFILITIFVTNTLLAESNPTDILIKSIILGVILIFELRFIYKLFKEPTFLEIFNGEIILRPSFFLFKRKIPTVEIIGYSSIVRPYFLNRGRTKFKYSAYLLYLKNGRKVLITEYYYLNFNKFSNAFRKNGLKFLGTEENEWSIMRRKFKYDKT
ncbi:hypothetical protein [Fluviicola taffensis]|uniref:Uncharacterized protein n=1 Tax=Fluviicola taffensis (strain DSM 16823 / NCIMB 13979 / RW262) TaxID=755732 RepID=F2IC39_FLUTR|nr:hypothetical protein [Fluviicola taffensis]AEA43265.1 hypothetical protein Fluta_1270 [Fluviicola taffensis DSM 16823]